MNRFTYDQVTSSKLPSSYPGYVLSNIKLLSINKNKSSLVGSFSFSYPQYPSDVDVREVIEGNSFKGAIDYFINGIRMKVLEIQNQQYYWLLEVKIGFDERYNFSITDPDAGARIAYLYENDLISNDDLDVLRRGEPEEADLLLQNYAKLRWSTYDILNGYKMLPGNHIIRLSEAIPMKGVINMEVIGMSNGKFMDLSNFFALVYHEPNGTLKAINLPQESIEDFTDFFAHEVKSNIKKLYYSKIAPDYAKVIKRMFSLGRFIGDQGLVMKVYPYLNSVTSLAGQKKSEIALLIKLIEHTHMVGVPMHIFINQLSNIQLTLSNIIDIDRDVLIEMNEILNNVMYGQLDPDTMIAYLSKIKKVLSNYVSVKALAYLRSVGLAPPPNKYIN
jgi:hypothetical protein